MDEARLYLGESLGFRAWRLEAGRLASLNQDYVWSPGDNAARCLRPPAGTSLGRRRHGEEAIPARGCNCGLFAYNSLDAVEYYGRALGAQVLGAVSGAGRVRVYRHGFRAQRARVLALLMPPWGLHGPQAELVRRQAESAAAEHGVPVFSSDQIPAFLAFCAAQEQVEPIPEAERPGRWASIASAALAMISWTVLAVALIGLLIYAMRGISAVGVEPIPGHRLSSALSAAVAVLSALVASLACWRALRRAEELHFFNVLEALGKIDRSAPPGRRRASRGLAAR